LAPLLRVGRGLRRVLRLTRVLLRLVLLSRIRLLRRRIRLRGLRTGLLRPLELLRLVAAVLWHVLAPRL
ncbi:hypothetical protein O4215_25800, partial [Rhodococcus maanshanensis]|uniref:hypothetical protein n=1 Tax=Rhodococcus maanshanensis TaxID=183556 RepID=UPI0022B3087A